MKTTVALLALAVAASSTAHAQYFTPGHRHGGYSHRDSHHSHTTVRVGVGFYPSYYYSPYRYSYYGSPAYYDSGYYAAPSTSSGSRASAGLILGGIAGAIIGNNSGDLRHNAWRGAAIGAGAGWLLGTIADNNARARENTEPAVVSQPAVVTTTPATPTTSSVPQTVIINNNYYGPTSSMSSANSLFGR